MIFPIYLNKILFVGSFTVAALKSPTIIILLLTSHASYLRDLVYTNSVRNVYLMLFLLVKLIPILEKYWQHETI
jgi:hypothetical protein